MGPYYLLGLPTGFAGCATMSPPPADLDQIISSDGGHDIVLRRAAPLSLLIKTRDRLHM